jgi:pseudouridine-5'-phosphate glycosidase
MSISPPAPDCRDDLGLDPRLFCVSPEVAQALRTGFPVVALESTIITHGLPFPTNYETAIAAERLIRERGAVPATVAIVQGVVHVGASEEV